MPANTEQLNYVINFTTEYKNKGLEQARADLGRFQAQAQEALGVKAFYSGGSVSGLNIRSASTKYMGYGASGKYGYISKGMAEGQVSAQIGKSYEASLANIQNQFKGGSLTVGAYRKALTNLQLTYQKSVLDVNKLDKSSGSFLTTQAKLAERAIAVIPIWLALRAIYMGIINTISSGIKFLIEFESAMADIRIVGKGTEEEYKNLGNSILTMSKMFGVSASEALKAAKIFAQQGLTINETIAMTRNTMIASVILGQDMVSVSEELTAATRAYNISMEDSLSIVDKWQAVQKGFAVTSKDLADATKTAGASASALGISYDKFLGHVTSIIEVTRKTGAQAANALQMIYSRLLTVAKETIQVTGKVPIYQSATGKAVMETTHIFRSASDIIDDLALSWNTLNESQKIALATQVGSRRQLTPFIALMQNYNRGLEAEITSLKAAGEAYRDFQIKQETTAIKIKQMQSAWFELVGTIGDTSAFKSAIDSVKSLTEAISYLINANKTEEHWAKEFLTNSLLEAQTRENELKALQRLIELRDKYNKKLKETPESQKPQVSSFLDQINTAIGNREFNPSDLQAAVSETIRRNVMVNNSVAVAQLKNLDAKLKELKSTKTPSEDVSIFGIHLRGLEQINKASNETTRNEIVNIEKAKQAILDKLDKEMTEKAASLGLSEKEMELMKKAEEMQKKAEEDVKERTALLDHQAKMLSLSGETEEQILRWKIDQYKTDELLRSSEKSRYDQLKLTYELEEKISGEIKKQGDLLESAASSTFKDILSGKGGNVFTSITNAMGESFRNTIAESMGKLLVRDTGLGEFFGGAMQGLKGKIESGHKIVYDLIKRGHIDGANAIRTTKGATTAAWSGSAGYAGVMGEGSPIVATVMGQPVRANQTSTGMGGSSGGFWGNLLTGKNKNFNTGLQGAMLGYSGYSSTKASGGSNTQAIGMGLAGIGAAGVMGGIGMAGVGTAMTAASAGGAGMLGTVGAGLAAIGPMGWIALAAVAAGLALSMFGGGEEKTSTESRTSTNTISSKINVTNKQLELVNRNLIAMRTEIRQYILPQSAYFSSKSSLDEEFSISSRMASVE